MHVKREDVIQAIHEAKVVANPDNLRDDVKLVDQGLDSLGFLNVILILDEKYGLETPDNDIDELTTINAIVLYLNDRLK